MRSAQPTVLDIPVTVQGSKIVEGTDQRELFKETTRTTIVFENGAVLKLNAKVQPGQCLFLRNDRSGREILCKVRESRQAGEAGYTDLEFTARDPEFWAVPELPAAANEAPETQKVIEPVKTPIAAPTLESIAPASEEIPAAIPETVLMSPSEPAPETPKALPEPEDWDDAKDAELAAALSAMEASSKASREPAAEVTKKAVQEGAPEVVPEPREKSAESACDPAVAPALPSAINRIRELIAVKNPIAIGIAATVLIAAVLGVAWHARGGSSAPSRNRAFAGSDQSVQQAAPTPAAAGVNDAAATPGVAAVQSAKATTADVGGARESNANADSAALARASKGARSSLVNPAHAALGQAMHRKPEKNDADIIPARIVWQSPTAIPPWAKDLEMDGTVTLDVLIDENGNVKETKPLSGPHPLWSAAEREVMLWIFEPGMSDGKPTATHMVLTVEFQK